MSRNKVDVHSPICTYSSCISCKLLSFLPSSYLILWKKLQVQTNSFYPFLLSQVSKLLELIKIPIRNYSCWLSPHCAWILPILDKQQIEVINN